jgi:hypothetical protein
MPSQIQTERAENKMRARDFNSRTEWDFPFDEVKYTILFIQGNV